MTYGEAVRYLDGLKGGPVMLGLERVEGLLSRLGDPQTRLYSIHVAGTNGKGSVAAMVCSIIGAAGRRAGLFTSPHLHDPRERIRIGSRPISEDDLSRLVAVLAPAASDVAAACGAHPTYFEFITALAIMHFVERGVDAAVFEVGLGGRLDATNVLPSRIQVITNIGMDHMAYLGSSAEEIAREKAAIIKDGGSVVTAEGPGAALEVIGKSCVSRGCRLYRLGKDIRYTISAFGLRGQVVDFLTWRGSYTGTRISLLGAHQAENAAVALGAAECMRQEGMEIEDSAVREGLRRARWPGRFEVVGRAPLVVLDGAHNPHGAAALARAIEQYLPGRRIDLILGVLKDKDYRSISSLLAPLAERILTTPVGSERTLRADDLARACADAAEGKAVFSMKSPGAAIGFALSGDADVICVAGSLYLVAEVRELLLRKR